MATLLLLPAKSTAPAINHINGSIVRVVEYSQVASLSAGDVIQMVKVPNGALVTRVIPQWSVSAGATTVDIGDGNDISAYAASLVISGPVVTVVQNYRGMGRSYSAEDTIDIVIKTVSATPASAQIKLFIEYTMQNGG
jgi:hypothetical protein